MPLKYAEVISQFHWNLCKNQPIYEWEELINFWWWSGPGYEFRITFYFPQHCKSSLGMLDLLAFLVQSPAACHGTRRNDWRRQRNELLGLHLGGIRRTTVYPHKSEFESRIAFESGNQSSSIVRRTWHWRRHVLSRVNNACRLKLKAILQLCLRIHNAVAWAICFSFICLEGLCRKVSLISRIRGSLYSWLRMDHE